MNFIIGDNEIYVKEDENVVARITFYEEEPKKYVIDHTFVHESLRGQGIAKKLVDMAVKHIEDKGGKYRATCSYAKKIIDSK